MAHSLEALTEGWLGSWYPVCEVRYSEFGGFSVFAELASLRRMMILEQRQDH